jgi:hypothetical protein
VILVGVGVTQRWFVAHVEPRDIVTMEGPQQEQKAVQASPEMRKDLPQPSQTVSPPSELGVRQRDAGQARQSEEAHAKGQDEKLGYVQAPVNRLEQEPAAPTKDKRRTDIAQSSAGRIGQQQEFWANGTLVTQAVGKMEADEVGAAKTTMTRSVHAASAPQMITDSFGQITLEQRPASNLPASKQSQQQLYSRQAIQTLVRQSAGETHLVLYPGSPFDSTQLHYARAQQISSDSLVVQIGNQQIGYRFPASSLAPGQVDSAKPVRK